MTPLTCPQVEEQLELFALGECEEPLRAAVADHVASCAACARSLAQARQLLGLLDVEFQIEDRLRKLLPHLNSAIFRPRPQRRVLHFPGRLAALAAMLLLAVGLSWRTPSGGPEDLLPSPGAAQSEMKLDRSLVRAIVWTSPHQPGRDVASDRIPLEQGQLWVCVEPAAFETAALTVMTPAGDVHSTAGCFHVAAAPAGVVVTVFRGEVEMVSPQGRVTGRSGNLLVGRPGETPRRLGGKDP